MSRSRVGCESTWDSSLLLFARPLFFACRRVRASPGHAIIRELLSGSSHARGCWRVGSETRPGRVLDGSFHFGLLVAIAVLVLAGVFSFLAAVSLLAGSRSGRNLGLVAGFLGLITGPLGVLLGAYTLLALFPRGAGTPAAA